MNSHNEAILQRMRGMPACETTEQDPRDPNVRERGAWFQPSLDAMHANRALEACAEFEIRLWTETLGEYADSSDRLVNKVALIPQAQTLLRRLLALPRQDRLAIAAALRAPVSTQQRDEK